MLFQIQATPKQQKKINFNNSNLLPVPEKWEEFVAITTIRSGGNMVRFDPYYYQKIISKLMDKHNNLVVVKSRQLGITQIVLSKFLHRASRNPAYSSMCFMRNGDDASAISRRARQMVNCLGEYITPDSDNVGYLKLRDKGEVYFKNSSREGSRSYDSVLDFLFDEAAFSENIQQIYAASSPSGALSGDAITKMIISTPSAKSGWYWDKLSADNGDIDIEKLCIDVAEGKVYKDIPGLYWFLDKTGTVKLIIHWKAHPVYNKIENYLEYRMQQDGTDWETVLREYDLRFVDSSVAVFTSDIVRSCAIGTAENDRDTEANYYLGVDTSTTGNDYTVAIVLKEKYKKYSVVAIYRKRQQPTDYHLYKIGDLIKLYKPKIIGVEVTGGVGQVYIEQLNKEFKNHVFESIHTTSNSKPVLISNLQLALEKQVLKFPADSPITEELLTFIRKGKKLEAAAGRHDDAVLALSFALSVSSFNKVSNTIDLFGG
jgi:hypothetical protein